MAHKEVKFIKPFTSCLRFDVGIIMTTLYTEGRKESKKCFDKHNA